MINREARSRERGDALNDWSGPASSGMTFPIVDPQGWTQSMIPKSGSRFLEEIMLQQ
jgi:hypothetical protein